MNFDGAFVQSVMRIIDFDFRMNEVDSQRLSGLLGSREEFVAWLLLRRDLTTKFPEVGDALLTASTSVAVSTASPRSESHFPIFERSAHLAIEVAMKSLIEASESSRRATEKLNEELSALAKHCGRIDLIPQLLVVYGNIDKAKL